MNEAVTKCKIRVRKTRENAKYSGTRRTEKVTQGREIVPEDLQRLGDNLDLLE